MKALRLVLRAEGNFWNAYAAAETVQGAMLLGSISIGLVMRSPKLREHFMMLMQETFTEVMRGIDVGIDIMEWIEQVPADDCS